MHSFFGAFPNLVYTSFWRRYLTEAISSVETEPLLRPVTSAEEVYALFDQAERHAFAPLFPGRAIEDVPISRSEFREGSWERLLVANARELWVVRRPLGLDGVVLLVALARSGQLYLLTNRSAPFQRLARMNRWSKLAENDGCVLEARSMMGGVSSANFSTLTCRAIRFRRNTSDATKRLLKRLKVRAAGVSVLGNVLWKGSKRVHYRMRRDNTSTTGSFSGLTYVRDTDVPMFVVSRIDHIRPLGPREEDSRVWPTPGVAFYGSRVSARLDRLKAPDDALQLAMSMGTGVSVLPMLVVRANSKSTVVTWHEYDARPLSQKPLTGLSYEAQALHGSAYLTRAVRFLSKADRDYNADALRRSVRHLCHAYEGHYIEQHALSVCLAVEELATAMMVEDGAMPVRGKKGKTLHQVASDSFSRRKGRAPTRDELIIESMLSGTDWNTKVDYLRKKYKVKFVTHTRKDAVRLLRNGIIHAGRLLPNERRALAALHNLELFWHRVAWAMCGVRQPHLNVGRFS